MAKEKKEKTPKTQKETKPKAEKSAKTKNQDTVGDAPKESSALSFIR